MKEVFFLFWLTTQQIDSSTRCLEWNNQWLIKLKERRRKVLIKSCKFSKILMSNKKHSNWMNKKNFLKLILFVKLVTGHPYKWLARRTMKEWKEWKISIIRYLKLISQIRLFDTLKWKNHLILFYIRFNLIYGYFLFKLFFF